MAEHLIWTDEKELQEVDACPCDAVETIKHGFKYFKENELQEEEFEEEESKSGVVEITSPPSRKNDVGHCDAVEKIKNGFEYFKKNEFNKDPDYYNELAQGQNPKFLVFSCSDSRVNPSTILNFQPGEAFGTRNIGGIVPPFSQLRYSGVGAVIEYALTSLEVEVILVIGHSRCGGIRALMNLPDDGTTSNDFIDDWVEIALPAKAKVKAKFGHLPLEEQLNILERETVNLSLVNLLSYPCVKDGVKKKTIKLMGGHYDFVGGKFQLWEFKFVENHLLNI